MPGSIETTKNPLDATSLRQLPLFGDVPTEDLAALAQKMEEVHFEANQIVFHQGERVSAFFIVRSGALAAYRDAVGQPVQLLARLHQDDYFGEIALLGTGDATASVKASEESRLLRVSAEFFIPFVEKFPSVQIHLQMTAARRHSQDMASVLETGRRREVRIRCQRPVSVTVEGEPAVEMVLENLSLGGACLSGAPEDWEVGRSLSFDLTLREGALALSGSVCWRQGDTVGLFFDKRSPKHDMLVQMAIRLILEALL